MTSRHVFSIRECQNIKDFETKTDSAWYQDKTIGCSPRAMQEATEVQGCRFRNMSAQFPLCPAESIFCANAKFGTLKHPIMDNL